MKAERRGRGLGRRAFVGLLLGAAAGLLAGGRGRVPGRPLPGPPWSARGRASARVVGRAYLRLHPEESDPARLRARLGEDADALPGARAQPRERIRRDFERGDLVQVDGWLLSRYEARLCALSLFT